MRRGGSGIRRQTVNVFELRVAVQDDLHVARADLLVEAAQRQSQQTQWRASLVGRAWLAVSYVHETHPGRRIHAWRILSSGSCTASLHMLRMVHCQRAENSRSTQSIEQVAACAHGSPKRSMSGMATRVASGRCRCWYGATRVFRFRSAHRCSHCKHTTSRSARTWVRTTTDGRSTSRMAAAALRDLARLQAAASQAHEGAQAKGRRYLSSKLGCVGPRCQDVRHSLGVVGAHLHQAAKPKAAVGRCHGWRATHEYAARSAGSSHDAAMRCAWVRPDPCCTVFGQHRGPRGSHPTAKLLDERSYPLSADVSIVTEVQQAACQRLFRMHDHVRPPITRMRTHCKRGHQCYLDPATERSLRQ